MLTLLLPVSPPNIGPSNKISQRVVNKAIGSLNKAVKCLLNVLRVAADLTGKMRCSSVCVEERVDRAERLGLL